LSEQGVVTTLKVRHAIGLSGVSNLAAFAVVVTENATVIEIGGIAHGENRVIEHEERELGGVQPQFTDKASGNPIEGLDIHHT